MGDHTLSDKIATNSPDPTSLAQLSILELRRKETETRYSLQKSGKCHMYQEVSDPQDGNYSVSDPTGPPTDKALEQ